jgi:Ca2+-binding EF-hand superfamily protein
MNRLLAAGFAFTLTATTLTALVLTATAPGQEARPPRADAADPDPASVQDVVFLAEDRPVLLRLIVTIDGQPLRTVWEKGIERIFNHYDRNQDGQLSRDEAKAILPVAALSNGLGVGRAPVVQPKFADLDSDRDGSISPAELRDYYQRTGLPPVNIPNPQQALGPLQRLSQPPARDPASITAALWRALDTDRDGKLSAKELAAAEQSLLALDADDDEILSLNEAAPATNRPVPPLPLAPNASTTAPPLELVQKGQPARALAWRILNRYGSPDRGKAQPGLPAVGSLNPDELGWEPAIVKALDFNRNGRLEAFELARYAELPPDAVVRVSLSAKGGPTIKLLAGGKRSDTRIDQDQTSLLVGRTRVEFGSVAAKQGFPGARPLAKARVMAIFAMLDMDNNGYLDRTEAATSPFGQNFALIDTDGDGMLYERELIAFVERTQALQTLAEQTGVSLNVVNQSKSLFDWLDLNGDGRLSVWEMRQAPQSLRPLMGQDQRPLQRTDLPQSVQLTVQRGMALANPNALLVLAFRQQPTAKEPPEPTAGPMWFRKMDRNRDGFVSRREFLGDAADFDRLDRDRDGLISPQEAEQAEAVLRRSDE